MGWIAIDIFMELEMCVFFELFGEWTMLISSLSLFCRDAPTQFPLSLFSLYLFWKAQSYIESTTNQANISQKIR